MADFEHRRVAELHRQLMLSPAKVRRKYVERLEQLLLELKPERIYPFEFIYFRVTGFRPQESDLENFTGEEIQPDLHRSIELLSKSNPIPVEHMGEKVYTLDELEERFEVTRRTLRRWRRSGLVSQRYLFPDGIVRVGIRETAVDEFVERNEDSIEFASSFSRLTDAEEQQILNRVRRYRSEDGLSTTAAAARVADELGRAQETVRQVLKRHESDEADRGQATDRLTARMRRKIYREYGSGTPAEVLSRRYGRSRSTVYRVVNQEKARNMLRRGITYIAEDDFEATDADERILGDQWQRLRNRMAKEGGPRRPLTQEEERAVFRAYNYVKHKMARAIAELNPRRYVASDELDHVEHMADEAEDIKCALRRTYMPVVSRTARQHAEAGVHADRLMEEGRSMLDELIDVFDYRGRGRFESFLRLELQKAFARMAAGA